jgi:hypothetical protein
MQWAILSGIEGNLPAYEAVLADIRRQRQPVTDLFILGDLVGLRGDSEAVVRRVRSPKRGEPIPQVCTGWWEEQCFSLHGIRGLPDAPELVERYGLGAVKDLWEAVSRETVLWLADLDFGFHELDCLLIHGSTVSYGDELTLETPPITLYDRLIRADANTLFCGRSGLAFECWVEPSSLRSTVTSLDQTAAPQEQGQESRKSPRRVVGVGNVGRQAGQVSYALYNPGNDQVSFKRVPSTVAKGLGSGGPGET